MARAKFRLEPYYHGNQVRLPGSSKKVSTPLAARFAKPAQIDGARYMQRETQTEPGCAQDSLNTISAHYAAQIDKPARTPNDDSRETQGSSLRKDERVTLLLDLSGDKDAALEWARRSFPHSSIRPINKAELKWRSKREALARIRALAPGTFAIFTTDLSVQSARGSIILFAALSGARRVVFADRNSRSITRSRARAFIIEVPRLAIELLIGYAFIVPLSWALTLMLGACFVFRQIVRAGQSNTAKQGRSKNESLTILYVRATLVPSMPQSAGSAGGMASHVRGFTRGALALNHRIKFIASGEVGINRDGAQVKIINPSSTLSATRALFEIWNNLVFTIKALIYVTAEARSHSEIAFIYQRYSRFNFTGAMLSLVTGLPLMLEFNGSEVWASKHWDPIGQLSLLERFERLNQRAADLIFVVSDVERRNLIAEGIAAERIVFNPNGVDTLEFRPDCGGRKIRRELGIDEKIVVGFLGTFAPWHGAHILAGAATRVSKAAHCHFLFVGDGDQRSDAESIIESAGMSEHATFTGRIAHERVAAFLDACDVLVAPHIPSNDGSEFFGSPTKLFEYMAMARPVIASRLGQMADVIIDDENGLLVEPADTGALAHAIEKLASDEALRARLGFAARHTVIEHYTWQHNASRVFNAVISDK
jgi:glycosyltransferase involved in cell wall biosynthesis